MMNLTALDWIALILTAIGGINWGLVGAFRFNLVARIFGENSMLSRIVYIVVGLCAVYLLFASGMFVRKG